MSNNKSWNSIGEEIRDAFDAALKTGNFKDLGDVITGTVQDTVQDVRVKVGQAVAGGNATAGMNRTGRYGAERDTRGMNRTGQYAHMTQERKRAEEQQRQERSLREAAAARLKAPFKRIGRVSGVLYQVFGGIGAGVLGILSAVFGGLALGIGGGFCIAFVILFPAFLASLGMVNLGCRQRARLRRAEKYAELAGHNHYINLDELALHMNKKEQFILKDVKKMLEAGYFPEGHLDRQESCLMLDDRIYREYLELEKQKRVQEREQQMQRLRKEAEGKPEEKRQETAKTRSELEEVVAQGQEYIRRLRDMNDNIPGEEISAKLFRLENLLKEIFEGLQEHPGQLPQMKKFMNYYLPTTLKLVSAYEEFDDLSSQSEEIVEAKTEIEKTLDTINSAFEELLGRMFRDTAYDVTTDAQVLKTMLEQEGLAGQSVFEREKVPVEVPRA